jgi:large subunit ribosomal protein L25
MAKHFELKGNTRTQRARATRAGGLIPAVLYGHEMSSKSVQVDARQFTKVHAQTGSTTLVRLNLEDGSEHPVLIREVQRHPLKGHVLHADFYQVRMDEKIRARVPIHFTGESPAVKDLGGVLIRSMDEVELEALPQDLPHDIEADVSGLTEYDQVVHISDLELPRGVELFHEPDEVVALVQAPRTEQELEELKEEVTEDVEAVEGVKEEEEKPQEGETGEETTGQTTPEEE